MKKTMTETDLIKIGKAIKDARQAKGINEKDFADHFNISNNTLRSIEKGKDSKFSNVFSMLRYLNLLDILKNFQ